MSRIDTVVDKQLDEAAARATSEAERAALTRLRGKVAIANAKLAYQRWQKRFSGARWERLKKLGARPQQLLWASTGTKNPAYSDVLYIEELIGPETVNTMPEKTMDAFRDHGKVRDTLTADVDDGRADACGDRARRHLARCRHRQARRRRRDAVFRFIRQAQRSARRKTPAHVGQGARRANARAAGAAEKGVRQSGRGLAYARQHPPALERGRFAVDRPRRRRLARLARCRRCAVARHAELEGIRRRSAGARLQRRAASRHGRFKPRPRGSGGRAWDRRRVSPSCTFSIPPIRSR